MDAGDDQNRVRAVRVEGERLFTLCGGSKSEPLVPFPPRWKSSILLDTPYAYQCLFAGLKGKEPNDFFLDIPSYLGVEASFPWLNEFTEAGDERDFRPANTKGVGCARFECAEVRG